MGEKYLLIVKAMDCADVASDNEEGAGVASALRNESGRQAAWRRGSTSSRRPVEMSDEECAARNKLTVRSRVPAHSSHTDRCSGQQSARPQRCLSK